MPVVHRRLTIGVAGGAGGVFIITVANAILRARLTMGDVVESEVLFFYNILMTLASFPHTRLQLYYRLILA